MCLEISLGQETVTDVYVTFEVMNNSVWGCVCEIILSFRPVVYYYIIIIIIIMVVVVIIIIIIIIIIKNCYIILQN